jgi:hypothetical protein
MGAADIVVGIPFYNEADSIGHVLRTAVQGLDQYYPDAKSGEPIVLLPLGFAKKLPAGLELKIRRFP